jgi:hypothetical protein
MQIGFIITNCNNKLHRFILKSKYKNCKKKKVVNQVHQAHKVYQVHHIIVNILNI